MKTAAKNKTGTTLRMSFKVLDGSNLFHELLLTTRQKTKLRNAFNNNMSTDLNLSRAQISKIIQSGEFLGSLLSKLAGPLQLLHQQLMQAFKKKKKKNGSGTTTLIILDEEQNDIMKIVQAFEDFNMVLKGVTKAVKKETREQRRALLERLVGTLE